ncbi:putative Deoxyribodipyrimidine photolyase [Crocosphaera subtropica ATCC 51142]|uniref:Deoxyribodipyrimidine photolyase n=1 Tax=Crocosphaera subtropica (strain ATCC 51142 / BH68) TaxID=43989 RepID=B1WU38_CROS5|nr:cryptochrome/photolyase family protein [Crocosphaera subtropica]ACB52100.1 putative Deoxyribodipyrimidine photolyase [Crocosphaera subtropica ATCC 51142]
MNIGIWILGNQLHLEQAALLSCKNNKQETPVIFIESHNYIQKRPYHQQKLVLVFSAMRHFAEELSSQGWQVSYKVAHDFESALNNWIKENKITELRVVSPCDRPFLRRIQSFKLDCKTKFISNNHFLWSNEEFKQWNDSRKRLLLEDFYREGRKRFNILMDEDQPIGDKWNFDKQNRKPPKQNLNPPTPLWFEPDAITEQVIKDIKSYKIASYGKIEPFKWGVTRSQALQVLDHFLENNLNNFGAYQDAMITGEYTMWHSLISPYINLGLLTPLEVIQKIEKAYHEFDYPLNSVEGLIRQILGWREYMYGIYQLMDDDYRDKNWFDHQENLPAFYWDSSQTDMNCLKQILQQVEETGYAHHIQRLMVLSNFALIIGVSPQAINDWFHSAFIDGYDWVMVPNVIGMGQFADGGILASKPYAASANYINKMSDYCKSCEYKQTKRTGEKACPFNFFYWDFLSRHQEKLKSLGRMNLVLANLKKIDSEELQEIQSQSQQWKEDH